QDNNPMKKIIVACLLLGAASASFADTKAKLDERIHRYTAKFEAMQLDPTKAVPADELKKARGVVLLDRTKAGFLFAYQGGGGVAIVKDGNTENYGAAAFLSAGEASLGFQVGGEHSFYVILLMTPDTAKGLTDSKVNLKSEAGGTAGDKSGGAE